MKPSALSGRPSKAPSEDEEAPHVSSETESASSQLRPRLSRSSPVLSPDQGQSQQQDPGTEAGHEHSGSAEADSNDGVSDEDRAKEEQTGKMDGSGEDLEKLRDAMHAKLLHQQRSRRSYGSGSHGLSSRVSPIKEEEGAMSSGSHGSSRFRTEVLRTSSNVSTASTESTHTVRASVPSTPAAGSHQPLRTPSYPFPYVPGTPKTWVSQLQHPFASPSTGSTGALLPDQSTPGLDSLRGFSEEPTPLAEQAFLPPGLALHYADDARFPTPNLYDLVLQLNSEPGLEQWWVTTTNIMHDHFKAERATLIMPLDPTDIENVPWGLKASFSMTGSQAFRSAADQYSHDSNKSVALRPLDTVRPQKLHRERLRPHLESRHSYAGHGWEARETLAGGSTSAGPIRPAGPQRTATHAAGMEMATSSERISGQSLPLQEVSQPNPSRSQTDSSGSTRTGSDEDPYAEIFPGLRRLDHEVRPLIEPSGVMSVLAHGRVVAITRDYLPEAPKQPQAVSASAPEGGSGKPTEVDAPISASAKLFGNYRHVLASENTGSVFRDYEEYEQQPVSPWAQSPAPSPAIQADEEENPFFRSEEQQIQDSFTPALGPRDYSKLGQVEAIGVDGASTVLHIPLIHPTMSQTMSSVRQTPVSTSRPGFLESPEQERKVPAAILSILCSAVPYPVNLTQSLRLLGPHLATSFVTAQHFSSSHNRLVTIRNRRTASGQNVTTAPMTIEPLGDISNVHLGEPQSSLSGSVTSPSEYSAHSKQSPSSSLAGTPGWDPATHGWPSSRSATNTPAWAASEMVDNYFEARKRTAQRSGSNTSQTPVRSTKRPPSTENKSAHRRPSPSGDKDSQGSRGERRSKANVSAIDDRTAPQSSRSSDRSPSRTSTSAGSSQGQSQPLPLTADADKRHSQLHSYGADIQNSFGLPSASQEPAPPGTPGHKRTMSYPEEMPPPSERLLRTIIDSVPVQIFTTEPETGRLTWVNSKFLVYRGLEPRQVINDPWQAIHPNDRNDFTASWHRSLRTSVQLQQKVRLERFDGCYRWFYVRAAPLKDKRSKIVHWIGTMMDFHEQHIAETNSARQQETAASEAKYRTLANSSPQIVFAVNKTKGVIFCNTQWLHYAGQTEAQALGVGFMDHVHPDDLSKCKLPTFDESSDQPTNVPTSLPPGLMRSTSTSATSSSGSSETERGLSSADSSPLTGNLPQRKLSELASTGILKVTRDADGRPSYSTEVRLKSKDGEYRWHLVRVIVAESLVQSEQEDSDVWYGTCTDISDHKALERDLKETMDEKSRFLSNMSHEIRTPLNGITGMVNFLIDSNLTAEQMEHVNIIRASTEGLRGLINDILDLSKAEAGMIQISLDWLHVRALIEEVNDLTSAMAIDKGLELNYIVEEDVPMQVKGDRFRLRQILLNIVGNAIKFTSTGEVFVRCSVQKSEDRELEKNELFIRFEVIDTGRGFSDKEAEFLFKRFSQIDGSSTRQHGGTGLGLVISRQLAQLHGGDMSAKGVPGKGSTFKFFVKATLPSKFEQPPPPPATPGGVAIPILPIAMATPIATPGPSQSFSTPQTATGMPSTSAETMLRAPPKFLVEHTQSPSPYVTSPEGGRDSSSAASSISSDPSSRSVAPTGSLRSERSSASSVLPDAVSPASPMVLSMPTESKPARAPPAAKVTSPDLKPRMYSILVICPLKYSREATVEHIDKTLPKNIPHQITARESLMESQKMLGGDNSVIFTHIVVVLQDDAEIIALLDQVLNSPACHSTKTVVITDLSQRRRIMDKAPKHNYENLAEERRLRFVFKPLKPSRFAAIFDPQKEREMSTDQNQDSAQQVAITQKQVFEEISRRLGNRDKRVLLVEDNRTNQLVVLKFLAKVSIAAEKVNDGVECTEKIFSRPPGYYSIILCDLHMPNKDGYQTCKEIRRWERMSKHPHLPIIALSANVLGDVYQKCVDAGFNSYLTKPVDFKELAQVLITFMDPGDPSKPHEFMKKKVSGKTGRSSEREREESSSFAGLR